MKIVPIIIYLIINRTLLLFLFTRITSFLSYSFILLTHQSASVVTILFRYTLNLEEILSYFHKDTVLPQIMMNIHVEFQVNRTSSFRKHENNKSRHLILFIQINGMRPFRTGVFNLFLQLATYYFSKFLGAPFVVQTCIFCKNSVSLLRFL